MSKKIDRFPSKTHMNLVMKEKSEFSPKRVIPFLIVIFMVATALGKLAVADRLAKVNAAEEELNKVKNEIAQMEKKTKDYDKVLKEYNKYSVSWMTEEEKSLLERIEVLDLLEDYVAAIGGINQFSVTGNVLAVDISGVTLDDASKLVETLYGLSEVSRVYIYNANNEEQKEPKVSMLIYLTAASEGGIN